MKYLTKCPTHKELLEYFQLIDENKPLSEHMQAIDDHLMNTDCPKCNQLIAKLDNKI